MTRSEHLLKIAEEECNEIAQRISKALRFGVMEIQPGQHRDNETRIYEEYAHLQAMFHMLELEEVFVSPDTDQIRFYIRDKKQKVEQFLLYSKECGTLE